MTRERPMAIGITTVVLACLLSAGAGGGLTLWLTRDRGASEAEAVEASAHVAEATGEAVEGGIEAATAEARTDADTRQAVAEMDATTIAVSAAVQPGATRTTVALAGYLGCVSGSQGKGEGSAAYGCPDRGKALDAALLAMPEPATPVETAQP